MAPMDITTLPLVVDLDGTLTPTDTLVESVAQLVKRNPLNIFRVLFWLVFAGGRAQFKQCLADHVGFSAGTLPWRDDFVAWLRSQRDSGRRIILATAAHETIAAQVSSELKLFDGVIATNGVSNLKGVAKLAAIQAQVGERFAYAGDSRADLAIWAGASTAILVNVSKRISKSAHQVAEVEKQFIYPASSMRVWMRALRVHQWIKNVLLLVPLCAAFAFSDLRKDVMVLLAILAFSLAASATYIMNDIWDLGSDRVHARKRARPFASGELSLLQGVAVAFALLVVSVSLAWGISAQFCAMLLAYIFLTTWYSWTLKKYVLIDVIMLAMLYTFRVLAGAVATSIALTPWLLAFCIFIFFSLALVKRCAELVTLRQAGKDSVQGRDYQVGDLAVLWPLGIGASLCSVVVLGLYIGTPGAALQYANTNVLWVVGIGLLYWISRLWIKTARGEMHDDPIVFAMRDAGCRTTVLLIGVTIMFAHLLR